MKKKTITNALFGTVITVSAMLFAGCSSDDGLSGTTNDGSGAKASEVAVDLVLNVATGNTATTRMTAANTQATEDQVFRGIENAVVVAFTQKNGDALQDGKHISSPVVANKVYDMGTIMNAGEIAPNSTGATTPKSRRVIELSLPTETNTLMFWGKAIKTAADTHMGNNQQGAVIWTMDKDLNNIQFELKKRIPVSTTDPAGDIAFKQYENLIADVLTQLLNKKYECQADYQNETHTETRAWKDYITWDEQNSKLIPKANLSTLGGIVAGAFISMNTFQPDEVRAGSGPSVAMMLSDLCEVIDKCKDAAPTSSGEAITKAFASHLRVDLGILVDPSSKKWVTTINNIKEKTGKTSAEIAQDYNLVTKDLNDFPRGIFNVPQGATILDLAIQNETDDNTRNFVYSYKTGIPTYAMDGGTGGSFNPLNYRYPAELCYFGNSPIRVTDDTHQTTEYPDGTNNWDADASWEAGATGTGSKAWTKNAHVLSSTRSVAMQENINYGTALLKSTVRYGASQLKDNNKAIQERNGATEEDNIIDVGPGSFTLTGILIGGVEPTVGWNYVPVAANPKYESFVYDTDLPSTAIPDFSPAEGGNKSVPNYTLLWDNWNPANKDSKQNVVYIALEFVNNTGKNFWGRNNMIRNGATFYITGKLDPDEGHSTEDRSEGITWPLARGEEKVDGKSYYALPPYNEDGTTIKKRRVFIQDFMTTADFVIGANSLKSAIVEVPDLRSSQISLGLSVDLKWQTGLNFNNIILGE